MKNIRTALVLAASLAVSGVAFAQAKVVPAQSQITFAIKEMGVSVEGKFTKWTADIAFDPKKPEAGKVAFTIATGSAAFGAPETDAEVPKPEWFNVAKFPNATFASTAIASDKMVPAIPGKVIVACMQAMTPKMNTGELMMAIFDEEVEHLLVQPTFITHYPLDVSPPSI